MEREPTMLQELHHHHGVEKVWSTDSFGATKEIEDGLDKILGLHDSVGVC